MNIAIIPKSIEISIKVFRNMFIIYIYIVLGIMYTQSDEIKLHILKLCNQQ